MKLSLLFVFVLIYTCLSQMYIVQEFCENPNSKSVFMNNVCTSEDVRYYCDDGTPYFVSPCDDVEPYPLNPDEEGCEFFANFTCTDTVDFSPEEYCILTYYLDSECMDVQNKFVFKTDECVLKEVEKSFAFIKDNGIVKEYEFIGNENCEGQAQLKYTYDTFDDCISDGYRYYTLRCFTKDDKKFDYLITSYLEQGQPYMTSVIKSSETCIMGTKRTFYGNFFEVIFYDNVCEEIESTYFQYYRSDPYAEYRPSNILTTDRNAIFWEEFDDVDDCKPNTTDIFDIVYMYVDDETCEFGRLNGYSIKPFNDQQYKLIIHSGDNCDTEEELELNFKECVKHDALYYTIKAFKPLLPYFIDYMECTATLCVLNREISLNETVIIDYHLEIGNETIINLNLSVLHGLIIEGKGLAIINGGSIVLDFGSEDVQNAIDTLKKNNNKLEIFIIEGEYEGRFNGIKINVNSNSMNTDILEPVKIGDCEKLGAELTYKDKSISALFTLDDSGCGSGVKWWVIVITVCSILIVFVVIFIVLVMFHPKVKSFFLPYHRS